MVAFRALLARGHRFEVRGTCFDFGVVKPKAPQYLGCFMSFAISKAHILSRSRGDCISVAVVATPPLVHPQRLWPKRVCHKGGVA